MFWFHVFSKMYLKWIQNYTNSAVLTSHEPLLFWRKCWMANLLHKCNNSWKCLVNKSSKFRFWAISFV